MSLRSWIFVVLVLGYVSSQFFRSSTGVIAPDLMRDLALTPEAMGALGGAFFLMFGVAQLPLGIALDRFGPWRVMAALLTLAALGSLLFARAESAAELSLARGLMGLGCAAGLMGSLVVFARWFKPDSFNTVSSWLIALGGSGTLLATEPLALASETVGWRGAFMVAAAFTLVISALIALIVRDAPADHPHHQRRPEAIGAIVRGLGPILLNRRLHPLLVMGLTSYPTMITILALWGGPYLSDVHGLDVAARGRTLLFMSLAVIVGLLVIGPLDRLLDTRKWIVVGAALVSIALHVVLVAAPDPSLGLAVAMLVLIGFVSAYNVVLFTQVRMLVPEHQVGRAITAYNALNMGGVALLQVVTGLIIGAFPATGTGAPVDAYRAVFAFLGVALCAALIVYLRCEDIRPSRDRAARAAAPGPDR